MKNTCLFIIAILLFPFIVVASGPDSTRYQLRLSVPLLDFPQNKDLPYQYPSMNQALEFSSDMYELGYLGIDKLGNALFKPKTKSYTTGRKLVNGVFKYAVSLGFSKYGSELPIPLGVWAHEEFHRAVLGVGNVASKNGNWLGGRWNGSVYGVSDSELSDLKSKNPSQLLYSYVAGMQSEILLNQKISVQDFYKKRSFAKNALLLYNAHYVFNYFKFAVSAASDSVKILAPRHENTDPRERDYAGADPTAWVYDIFNPNQPYTERDAFPHGEGVNRRIGFSDLSADAQRFLEKQKKLSLLNFVNPAIFFVNRINLGRQLSFNFFAQYAPTHFGNDVAIYLPVQYKKSDVLLGLHQYSSYTGKGFGVDLGTYNRQLSERFETDFIIHLWEQPETFFSDKNILGGSIEWQGRYKVGKNVSVFISASGKTEGWQMGNPYLKSNFSSRFGFNFDLRQKAI